MKQKYFLAGLLATFALPAHAQPIFFDSFESPAQNGGYSYGGTDAAGAMFIPPSSNPDYNGAGIQANGSAFGYQAAPDGVQTAQIQGQGSFTETVTGLATGNLFALSFFAAQRPGYANDPISVSYTPFGGTGSVLLTLTASSTSFADYSTTFTGQGDGSIIFAGLTVGSASNDVNIGVDAVSISAVPLPPALPMFGAALLGLGAVGFRQRRKRPEESAALAA